MKHSNTLVFVSIFFSTSLYCHNKFILTGGPFCGKTTVIKELGKRKYQTCPEAYGELYKEAKALGILSEFLSNTIKQRWQLLKKHEEQEAKLDSTKPAFLDRSIPDVIFYGNYLNLDMPQDLITRFLAHKSEYGLVFIFEPLPKHLYNKTEVRYETWQEAVAIHEALLSGYITYGFNICMVPFDTVENRVQFVLRKAGLMRGLNCSQDIR